MENDSSVDINCVPVTRIFQNFVRIEFGFSFLLGLITIATIVCHRALRKQHHIFSCNIAIADLLGTVLLISKDAIFSTSSHAAVSMFPPPRGGVHTHIFKG